MTPAKITLFLLFFLPCVYAGLAVPDVTWGFGLAAGIVAGAIGTQILE